MVIVVISFVDAGLVVVVDAGFADVAGFGVVVDDAGGREVLVVVR